MGRSEGVSEEGAAAGTIAASAVALMALMSLVLWLVGPGLALAWMAAWGASGAWYGYRAARSKSARQRPPR